MQRYASRRLNQLATIYAWFFVFLFRKIISAYASHNNVERQKVRVNLFSTGIFKELAHRNAPVYRRAGCVSLFSAGSFSLYTGIRAERNAVILREKEEEDAIKRIHRFSKCDSRMRIAKLMENRSG